MPSGPAHSPTGIPPFRFCSKLRPKGGGLSGRLARARGHGDAAEDGALVRSGVAVPARPSHVIPADMFTFTLEATEGRARAGTLTLPHGVVETPAFMPVGTHG